MINFKLLILTLRIQTSSMNNFLSKLTETINKHAPIKPKQILNQPLPYMNRELKNAIYKKRMLHNKYRTNKTASNFESFRKRRNLVTSY